MKICATRVTGKREFRTTFKFNASCTVTGSSRKFHTSSLATLSHSISLTADSGLLRRCLLALLVYKLPRL